MEIFHDAQGKIAQQVEPRRIIQHVSAALSVFIADNLDADVEQVANENQIVLRRRSSDKTFEIYCDAPDNFHVERILGLGAHLTQTRSPAWDRGKITLTKLDRRVISWLQE